MNTAVALNPLAHFSHAEPFRPGSSGGQADDAFLLGRIGDGDSDAFAELVSRHEAWARSFACRLVGNLDDAEDIAQESFLQLWSQAARWKTYSNVRKLLAMLLTRRGIDLIRRKKPSAVFNEEILPPDTPFPALHAKILLEERQRLLESALARLPVRQRMAVLMFHTEEMTLAQGAEAMELTPKAFESLLIRGRTNLKSIIAGAAKS